MALERCSSPRLATCSLCREPLRGAQSERPAGARAPASPSRPPSWRLKASRLCRCSMTRLWATASGEARSLTMRGQKRPARPEGGGSCGGLERPTDVIEHPFVDRLGQCLRAPGSGRSPQRAEGLGIEPRQVCARATAARHQHDVDILSMAREISERREHRRLGLASRTLASWATTSKAKPDSQSVFIASL